MNKAGGNAPLKLDFLANGPAGDALKSPRSACEKGAFKKCLQTFINYCACWFTKDNSDNHITIMLLYVIVKDHNSIEKGI